ncbi:MAG: RNA-binding protein [Candidatus Nealsonbacteria bacterium CG10_big_fil_rev_8_21_14_0_10_36_23]|uniref:RNA-binding protein n=1 Tax=Candidatus Nealsonbacteria bacterium CG10_big_fil_rev_8_21_14_0_10_36_23 TaxID=1974709 RepID=A0A2H0TKW5_9BACT|nr:MAG: RNA-binding protein [Candidatus Nealsonbacteria bacterium CG10_big_fil_rev_8_21_14_0_10_36_23]
MAKIEKKVWPEFFQKILNGDKTFELRLADFKCSLGDILILREWTPKTKSYTGRVLRKKVIYVLKTKNVKFWPKEDVEKFGFQIISFK